MKINMGILALGASGSTGGVTASRNRYGYYLRARTPPVNPNTERQMTARSIFQFVTNNWSQFTTQLQRDAWQVYADAIVWKGSLGLDCKLTGFSHFLRSGCSTVHAGGTSVFDGPVILTLPGADTSFVGAISEATQLLSVTFNNGLAWANEVGGWLLVAMSSPKGAGRYFIGGPYRVVGAIEGDGVAPPVSPITFPVGFPVAADQKVDVTGRIIRADGRVSQMFQDTIVVAA